MKGKVSKKRNTAVIVLIAVVFAAFLFKLWDIQVVSAGNARQEAVKGVEIDVEPVRGEILDRDGNTLATSRQVRTVVFNYFTFPSASEKEKRNEIICELLSLFDRAGAEWVDELPIKVSKSGKLYFAKGKENEASYLRSSAFLDLNPYATVQNCFDALVQKYSLEAYPLSQARDIASVYYSMVKDGFNSGTPYVFAKDISAALASDIKEKSDVFTGVDVQVKSEREYPDGTVAAHVLGIVGAISPEEYETKKNEGYSLNDTIGKNGIEYAFESNLRGEKGKKRVTTDSDGNTAEKYITLPQNGDTVILTIRKDLQKVAQDALEKLILRFKAENANVTGGSVVVMDTKNNDILACASYPSYDLSKYSKNASKLNSDPDKPLWNRALMSTYTPGSTIKPAVAMAGLEEKIIDKDTVITCNGVYTHYKDYRPTCTGYHGRMNVIYALYNSCNIFFYETSRLLGIEKLNDYFTMFGLGEETGVEIGESKGIVDSVAFRTEKGELWTPGLTIQAGIGHGDNQFTPVQLCSYASVIANRGVRHKAHFVKSIMKSDYSETVYTAQDQILSEANFSDKNWDLVYEGMLLVGTESYVDFSGVPVKVAAKTGTTTVQKAGNGKKEKNNGLILAFAPYDDPQIAVSVVVEGATSGGSTAPVAAAIMEQYFAAPQGEQTAQTEGVLLR